MVRNSTSFETDESRKHHGSNRYVDFTYSDIVKGKTNTCKKPVSVIVNGNVVKVDPLGGSVHGTAGFIPVARRARSSRGKTGIERTNRSRKAGTSSWKGNGTIVPKSSSGSIGTLGFKKKNRFEERKVNTTSPVVIELGTLHGKSTPRNGRKKVASTVTDSKISAMRSTGPSKKADKRNTHAMRRVPTSGKRGHVKNRDHHTTKIDGVTVNQAAHNLHEPLFHKHIHGNDLALSHVGRRIKPGNRVTSLKKNTPKRKVLAPPLVIGAADGGLSTDKRRSTLLPGNRMKRVLPDALTNPNNPVGSGFKEVAKVVRNDVTNLLGRPSRGRFRPKPNRKHGFKLPKIATKADLPFLKATKKELREVAKHKAFIKHKTVSAARSNRGRNRRNGSNKHRTAFPLYHRLKDVTTSSLKYFCNVVDEITMELDARQRNRRDNPTSSPKKPTDNEITREIILRQAKAMQYRELTVSEKLVSLALTYLMESAGVTDRVCSNVVHGQSKSDSQACKNSVCAKSETSRSTRKSEREKRIDCAHDELPCRICTELNGRNCNSEESFHGSLVLIDHDHAVYPELHSDLDDWSESTVSSDDYSLVSLSTLPHERTAFANSTRQSETSDIGTQADTQREPAQITLDSEAQITSTDQLSAHSHQDDNGDESASSQATTRPKSPPSLPSIDPRDIPVPAAEDVDVKPPARTLKQPPNPASVAVNEPRRGSVSSRVANPFGQVDRSESDSRKSNVGSSRLPTVAEGRARSRRQEERPFVETVNEEDSDEFNEPSPQADDPFPFTMETPFKDSPNDVSAVIGYEMFEGCTKASLKKSYLILSRTA